MSQILEENIDSLIKSYDDTQSEIIKIQEGIGDYVSKLLGGIKGAHKDFFRNRNINSFTKQLNDALQNEDGKVKKCLDILGRALKSRTDKISEIKKKIEAKADPELSKALSGALQKNEEEAMKFQKSLQDFTNIINSQPVQQPVNQQPQTTQQPPVANQATQQPQPIQTKPKKKKSDQKQTTSEPEFRGSDRENPEFE